MKPNHAATLVATFLFPAVCGGSVWAETAAAPSQVPAGNSALDRELLLIAGAAGTDKVGKGDADKIEDLLKQGANPNAKDERDTTVLVWTLNFGKDDAAQVLIRHGADGNAKDANGTNAAWTAAFVYFCPGALELMIKKGVDVKGLDKQGRNILVSVTQAGSAEPGKMNYLHDRVWTDAEFQAWRQRERRTIDLLIAAGVDFQGKDGSETPLMSAVKHGHAEAVRTLIEHGANPMIKDSNGNTAMSLAQDLHPELAPLLEAHAK